MLPARNRISWLVATIVSLLGVAAVDGATGAYVSMLAFYLVPVEVAVVGLGLLAGIVTAVAAAVSIFLVRMNAAEFAGHLGVLAWDAVMCALVLCVATIGLRTIKQVVGDWVAEERQ